MTEQIIEQQRSLFDRVLEEVLKTPKFKATLNIMLNTLDGKSAASIVRTLFWTDSGVLLSLVGSLPAIGNAFIEMFREIGEQFNGFPTGLIMDLMESLEGTVDGKALGEGVANLSTLIAKFSTEDAAKFRNTAAHLAGDVHKGYREKLGLPEDSPYATERWIASIAEKAKDPDSLTSRLIRGAAEAMRDNPDFATHVMRPLLEGALEGSMEGGVR
jgi:hypothetical protein